MEYKYNSRAGALNEAAAPARAARAPAPASQSLYDADAYVEAANTGVHSLPVAAAPVHAQSRARPGGPPPRAVTTGVDPVTLRGGRGMFHYTVQDGQRVRVVDEDGKTTIVTGPKRIFVWGKRVEPMVHHLAHPGEFLIVRFRDGRQEHKVGPAELWFDPRIHATVEKEDCLQIASKEAVVVYAKNESGQVSRRVVRGPAAFVPEPGEWLHTFSWHGSGGAGGYQKVPNGLVFQKLWFLPDQMYHDVSDVRTADDAVLTIRLMIFFELVDVDVMLDTTHDPIGDFVNAATSDVVEFTGRHDFQSFKRHTEQLNDLATYRQLVGRAEQCGYRIGKVVYRGYGAPESLQRMHDEAIEQRTRLALTRATQEQEQDLSDFKLGRDLTRAGRQREEQQATVAHEIDLTRRRQEATLRDEGRRREFDRAEAQKDTDQRGALDRTRDDARRHHLTGLKELGVDLTALLTQGRADRVIELRGERVAPHLHIGAGAREGGEGEE